MELTFKILNKENINENILNQMEEIEKQGNSKKMYNKEQLAKLISKLDYTLACFDNEKLAGYIQLKNKYYFGDDLYIHNFMIDRSYIGKGVDAQLFKKAFEDYIKDCDITLISVDVEKSSSAYLFYYNYGFDKCTKRSREGKENIVMVSTQYRINSRIKSIERIQAAESFFSI